MKKQFRITINGKSFEVEAELMEEKKSRRGSGRSGSVQAAAAAPTRTAAPAPVAVAADGAVPSPLAGKVVSIDVNSGDTVKSGDAIITLESMKMNTVVSAPADGTIGDILVNPGDSAEEGQPLLIIS